MESTGAQDIASLRACINDLVGITALPAVWRGGDACQVVDTLLEVLLDMLRLDFVYANLESTPAEPFIRTARVSSSLRGKIGADSIGQVLHDLLVATGKQRGSLDRVTIGGADYAVITLQLGLQGQIGVVVAGSRRVDFPAPTDRLLLGVATNQAVIGVHEARLVANQKRVAADLEMRVSQRTSELAAANEDLREEIAERILAEQRLREIAVERGQSEEALRRSEALLKQAQHLSSTGSWYWRVAGNTLEFSEQTCAIYGIDPGETITIDLIASRIHPEDLPILQEMIDVARGPALDLDYLYRAQLPDLSVKHLHLRAHGARDKEGELEYIGAIQDVTQTHLAEVALGKARSELAHVARVTTLGALTASIAHEVNQPLSGIVTNASTCLRMLGADPPNIEGAMETARRTIRDGHRASDVITRLRALFGKKQAVSEPVDLNDATREVIALSWAELQRSKVNLREELHDDLPRVMGDRVQLQQVILNLLLNALEAMHGIHQSRRHLCIRTAMDGAAGIRLSVQDAGAGVDAETSEKLFEAFYTTKASGMGIGLSVSRSIIERHHGRLWAARNDGRPGATFSFTVPCDPGL